MKFEDVKLSDDVIRATSDMGFEQMTPIQEKTLPLAMSGHDIIGQAQTGTGKTAAFGIPFIEKLSVKNSKYIRGLVVTPTRELAIQVSGEINKLGYYKGFKSLPVYGGQSIERQIKGLKKRPQVIVGTPGRLLDHMRRKTVRLENLEMVTLDEADEMLNMGFIEDIEMILASTPEERQTLMFSATIPKPVQKLAEKFLNSPELVKTKTNDVTIPETEQCFVEVQEKDKFNVFCRLLDSQSPEKTIVFVRTKKRVDELHQALDERGYLAEGIHGDLTQGKRDSVLNNFRKGNTDILVATDVASRGLDISGVTHIYNFDIPQDTDSYVHRIGRTGRAGESGEAITMVTSREKKHLHLIEKAIKKKIVRKSTPTIVEAFEGKQQLGVEKLLNSSKSEDALKHYKMAEELLEEYDSTNLVAGALNLLIRETEETTVKFTEESRGQKGNDRSNKRSKKDNYKKSKRAYKNR